MKFNGKQYISGLKYGYRSGLEEKISEQLELAGVNFRFEPYPIEYIKPETKSKYTPDFILTGPTKTIIIESKGRFMPADRVKHLLIKKQRPELDIRFVFSRSKSYLTKTSKTTYGDWCDKHGFLYADKIVPQEWIDEVK